MGSHTYSRQRATRDVMESLRRIVQGLRESSRRAETQIGISGAQLFVLATLAETPSLSLNELANRTHTHQSSVSTVVSRLVARGLVARVRTEGDRRRLALTLTKRGRRLVALAPDAAQARLVRSIEGMPPQPRRDLARGLAAMARGMDVDRAARTRMFFDDGRTRTAR
jgi:DNA-binding MarR family transcriptional regulator